MAIQTRNRIAAEPLDSSRRAWIVEHVGLVRYLEDHTGVTQHAMHDFDTVRRQFVAP